MIIISIIFIIYFLKIGPDYSKTDAGIHHPTCKEECPNKCTNQWKYYTSYPNKGWHVDSSINILCGTILRLNIILSSDFKVL